jgi:uncharacterized membrane protein
LPASARRGTVAVSKRHGEASVSNLIAVAYDDVDTAKNVLRTLSELSTEHAITLDDAVIAERRPDGKVKLHQSIKPGAAGAAGGALWGGLIGLLFLAPFLGMAVGAATGGAMGAMTDVGVDDKFMKSLAQDLQPGAAAVLVLVRESTPDKVLPRISPFGANRERCTPRDNRALLVSARRNHSTVETMLGRGPETYGVWPGG